MPINPHIDKLIAWTIARLGKDATADKVLAALSEGHSSSVPRPPDVSEDVVRAFRKRSKKHRLPLVEAVITASKQASLPGVSQAAPNPPPQTPLSSVSQQPTGNAQLSGLGEIARRNSLELTELNGEVYVSLRCFETLLGKRPDNLRRTLEARGFPLVDLALPNAVGTPRNTPGLHIDYIFAIVSLVDLHGLDEDERQRLFAMQRELPQFMRRYWIERLGPRSTEARPLLTRGGVLLSVAQLANAVGEKVVKIIGDFASRLDIRLDRIEHLLTATKTAPPKATSILVPNKFGIVKPLYSAAQVLEKLDETFGRCQRDLGIDSPEAVMRFACELGIYRTPHWGTITGNDEWIYDGSREATSSLSHMIDHITMRLAGRNGASTNFTAPA
jgi:hypothetical protein